MAADNPAIPPPTTRAAGSTGTVLVGTSSNNFDLAIPALINSMAFRVAFSRTSRAWCTKEQCSRMFTNSKYLGGNPISDNIAWNTGS
ncbi:hypothetical protein ES703_25549 [subsurface metagenome]